MSSKVCKWWYWSFSLLVECVYSALPHCQVAIGSATLAMHCLAAWGQWLVEPLQCIASLPGGSAQWNSCNEVPHYLGAVGTTRAYVCR